MPFLLWGRLEKRSSNMHEFKVFTVIPNLYMFDYLFLCSNNKKHIDMIRNRSIIKTYK